MPLECVCVWWGACLCVLWGVGAMEVGNFMSTHLGCRCLSICLLPLGLPGFLQRPCCTCVQPSLCDQVPPMVLPVGIPERAPGSGLVEGGRELGAAGF